MKFIVILSVLSIVHAYKDVVPVPMLKEGIHYETSKGEMSRPKGTVLLSYEMYRGPLNSSEFKKINGNDPSGNEIEMSYLCEYEDERSFCRYFHFKGIGHICKCCAPMFAPWDAVPKPLHDQSATKFYYASMEPNTIYKSAQSAQWMGGDRRVVEYEDKLLFVTGDSCTVDGKDGVSIVLPEREFDSDIATRYQALLKTILKTIDL